MGRQKSVYLSREREGEAIRSTTLDESIYLPCLFPLPRRRRQRYFLFLLLFLLLFRREPQVLFSSSLSPLISWTELVKNRSCFRGYRGEEKEKYIFSLFLSSWERITCCGSRYGRRKKRRRRRRNADVTYPLPLFGREAV